MYQLSEGFLEQMMNGEEINEFPIFQILAIKKLTNFKKLADDIDRFRLQVSDGRTLSSFVMLASPLNHLVHTRELTEYSIVRINKYAITLIRNNGQERSVMVVLNMEVIKPGYQVRQIAGNIDVSIIEDKLQLIDIIGE